MLENIPDDLKGKVSSMGEASLFGHLKNDGEEEKGSDAYVPPDRDKDTQLEPRSKFLHGAKAETLRSPDPPATVTPRNDLWPMARRRCADRGAGLGSGAGGFGLRRV